SLPTRPSSTFCPPFPHHPPFPPARADGFVPPFAASRNVPKEEERQKSGNGPPPFFFFSERRREKKRRGFFLFLGCPTNAGTGRGGAAKEERLTTKKG
ncbi:MAG: hypothetical protein BJ554DRAFT_5264, partial [Olpidium bornovanus]